jgi:3-hydroxyacyl-[acyl-carrier-protein] dehydratase
MKLFKDSLFKINSIKDIEGKFSADISFDSKHDIFCGHFPEKKVVPGVMLMQMVKEVSEEILKVEDTFITDAGMKFLSPVLVDECADLEVEISVEKTDDDSYKIKSIGKDRYKKNFKINITITK